MEPIAPFQRLQRKLAVMIAETPTGEKLPSEPTLAKILGVSRTTLREAMRTFESQGLILRRQGIGTFVVNRHQVIESGLEVLESIETLAGKIGLKVKMGDLKIEHFPATDDQAAIFGISAGDSLIQVCRTIHAEQRPVAYLIDLVPQDVLKPEDLKQGFTGSVLDLLLRRGSPMLSRSIAQIKAEPSPADVSRALQIQRGDVLLLFKSRLLDTAGRVVDFSTSYFLPGYFQFHVVRSVKQSG